MSKALVKVPKSSVGSRMITRLRKLFQNIYLNIVIIVNNLITL